MRTPFLIASAGSLVAGGVMLALPGTVSAAESVVQTVSLDQDINSDGSGTVDAFDPALGTLTSVAFAVSTEIELASCVENNSPVASDVTGGPFEGSVSITFPSDIVTAASYGVTLPTETLAAYDGNDGCLGAYDDSTVRFTSTPDEPDLQFTLEAETSNFSETLTATEDLAPYVGPGTVGFTYEGDSFEGVKLEGAWDLWFVGHGEVSITITYTYEPLQVPPTTTTTTPPGPTTTTTTPPGPTTTTTTPPGPTTTTTTTTPPGPTTTTPPACVAPPGAPGSPGTSTPATPFCARPPLPQTGSPTNGAAAAASFAVGIGFLLLAFARRRPGAQFG